MNCVKVNNFKEILKSSIEKVAQQSGWFKMADWEELECCQTEQETLYILQNSSLMQQITESKRTHGQGQGYSPTRKEMNEILSV